MRKIVDGTNRYSIVVNYIIIIKNDDKKNKYNICGNNICNKFIWASKKH